MYRLLYTLPLFLLLFGCSEDNEPNIDQSEDDFDRTTMLSHWADALIIPGYTSFAEAAAGLKAAGASFQDAPTPESMEQLRTAWQTAYLQWQRVSMFEIGPAESLSLRNNINLYPTNTELIVENVMRDQIDFDLPSNAAAQGFPALDYLLFGIRATDSEILDLYTSDGDANRYRTYVASLTNRIDALAQTVLAEWTSSYRNTFVANNGNSANASVDRLVNDYIFYYEKWLRAGKIGIPAGVFSASPLPDRVEALYNGTLAKQLFDEALDAAQDFFNGASSNGEQPGPGLAAYLDFLNTVKQGADLSQLINDQFEATRQQAAVLDSNFARQVETDNAVMLQTYDQLQLNVVLLKVDMLQALSINVDFIDADGD